MSSVPEQNIQETKAKLGAKNETESRKIPDTRSDYEQVRCEGLLCAPRHKFRNVYYPQNQLDCPRTNSPVSYKRGQRSRMSENTTVQINTCLSGPETMSLQKIKTKKEGKVPLRTTFFCFSKTGSTQATSTDLGRITDVDVFRHTHSSSSATTVGRWRGCPYIMPLP